MHTVPRNEMLQYFCLTHEIGPLPLKGPRQAKRKVREHTTSSNAIRTPAKSANTNNNNNNDGDGGDDGGGDDGGAEDGGDDDPSDIARPLPIVYRLTLPSHFLSCLLLAGMSWLFRESFLAAIPLIGLCALCAFPEKLQFLKGAVSSQGAKFEIRGKK